MAFKNGVYYDMSDKDYHEQHGEDEHHYSSSQLKTMLEDPVKFHREYILGKKPETPQALQDAFDVGTVVHTAILEPEKLKGSYVKFEGAKRAGKDWEDFLADNEGKIILTKKMLGDANNCIKNYKSSKLSQSLFVDGKPEASFFTDFFGLKVKVRCDWLGFDGAIRDVKTTSGNVRDVQKIKGKIKSLNYDMSAALYVDVVNQCIEQFELDIPYIETFQWLFVSKDKDGYSQPYDGKDYLELGRAKYIKAIEEIKKHSANGWSFPEEIISIAPFAFELGDWIKKDNTSDEDIL